MYFAADYNKQLNLTSVPLSGKKCHLRLGNCPRTDQCQAGTLQKLLVETVLAMFVSSYIVKVEVHIRRFIVQPTNSMLH